ncbi:MAG: hypothetical protein J6W11_02235 [Alphaproteobacteria bacterium]|nr:hypothetical protein [Alphaproteobacteria bacterium]
MKHVFLFFYILMFSFTIKAQSIEFSKYFDVDLDSPVPDLKTLKAEYMRASEVYDPRYIVSWELGHAFDDVWRNVITYYGSSEKRLRAKGEEELTEMIASLPKETYPYIGPFLHSVPNIPEKILNMPGIKETKNKFPERIAPQLAGIEDLEFLSPYLYILLMPEMWPENRKPTDMPRKRRAKIEQVPYDAAFYDDVLNTLEERGFGSVGRSKYSELKDRLRTVNVTKTSALTSADVAAFTNTLDGVLEFATFENKLKVISAGALLDYYEAKNGTALDMNTLKDIVNPCQRLALKIKWAGLQTQFSKAIAKEGFNLKDWALTCDKTIKAYRTVLISDSKLAWLKMYKKGVFNYEIYSLKPKWRNRQLASIYSLLEMYKTKKEDVDAVLKNEGAVRDKFKPFCSLMLLEPQSFI